MTRSCLRTLLTIALALPAGAQAHSHHHHGAANGAPGGFDYYLFSLSVAPSFCALSPANAAKDECRSLTNAAYQATPLTVHGLWPNRANVSVNQQPHDCSGAPLDALPADTAGDLARYMPGGIGLARHEWRTHGTCSGLSQEAYFGAIVRLAQRADATLGAAIRSRHLAGKTVPVSDLVAAAAAADPALGPAIVVDCQTPRGGFASLIGEVRIVLDKNFRPVPAQSVGLGQNSGCPHGAGVLPGMTPG